MLAHLEPIAPSEEDSRIARESTKRLLKHQSHKHTVNVVLIEEDGTQEFVEIPASAFRLFEEILMHMAKGTALTLTPYHHQMTTQAAADYLNVSRPYLIKLLEQQEISFHRVGRHRRIKFSDIQAYKLKIEESGKQALAELDEMTQSLGMDD
jgi:excisionase family DNA binding protein